jgi:hypothetical protein
MNEFIEIIELLPKLDSLKILSLSLRSSRCLSCDETERINSLSNKNQINKIYLENMKNIEEVCFLLDLCPQMIYLKIDSINNLNVELFLRVILLKLQTKSHHINFDRCVSR